MHINAIENFKRPIDPFFDRVTSYEVDFLFDEENRTRRMIKLLHETDDDTIQKTAEMANSVATFADSHDIIVVSGGSGKISKTLLLANGITATKIVTLDPRENTDVYKYTNAYKNIPSLSDSDRVTNTRKILEARGVDLSLPASYCIVDDHIDSGRKAKSYLDTFTQLFPYSEVDFTAFSALRVATQSKGQQTIPKEVTLLPHIKDPGYIDAQFYLHRLAFAASRLSYHGVYRKDLSEETREVGDMVIRDQLATLYFLGK